MNDVKLQLETPLQKYAGFNKISRCSSRPTKSEPSLTASVYAKIKWLSFAPQFYSILNFHS